MSNSIDPDETALSRLILIYAVCKSLLLSPVIVKEIDHYYICEQRRPRSACASILSEQGLRSPFIESMDTIQFTNEQKRRICITL